MTGFLRTKIYRTVIRNTPIVSNDVLIKSKGKYLLLRRTGEPGRGLWWTPGGRLYKNEIISDSVRRIAKEELGIKKIKIKKFLGVFEFYCKPGKLKEKDMHYISFSFLAEPIGKFKIKMDSQHSEYKFFTNPPSNAHPFIKRIFSLNKKKNFKAIAPVSYQIRPWPIKESNSEPK